MPEEIKQPKQLFGRDHYTVVYNDLYVHFDYFDNGDCVLHNTMTHHGDMVLQNITPTINQRVARFSFKSYLTRDKYARANKKD
jgi:hypothetical protein